VQAVYATGTVEASIMVRIAPRVAGRLVKLGADEGQDVKEGQILARLEDTDLRFSVAELEAKARYAQQQFQRSDSLFKRGFVTRDRVDQARSDLDAARAAVRRAAEQMGFMALKAPVDGRIIRRDGEVGDFIPVNQPVFFLSKADVPPRIEADVDEEDVAVVQTGQKVLIKADAFADRMFEGRVAEITPKGEPVARSYRVRVKLPADTPLMIGMTAETNIIVAERQNTLLVPSTALSSNSIWLVRNGRLVKQPVKVGAKGLDRTEILTGLTDHDQIVVQPRDSLRPGDKVQTILAASSPRSPANPAPEAGK
jgi:RND family efflux transporter MFP subunit